MTTGNSPEQSNGNPSQENLAAQAAREIIAKIRAIDSSGTDAQQQVQQKDDLALETLREYQRQQNILKRLIEAEKSAGPSEPQQKEIQKTQQNLGLSLIKACALTDNDIPVVQNPKANRILRELSKASLTAGEASAIQQAVGDYLLGGKANSIILSKQGETRSDFMKGVDNLIGGNVYAADKLLRSLVLRATDFEMTPDEMVKSFTQSNPESGTNSQNQPEKRISFSKDPIIEAEMIEAGLGNDIGYYQPKLTPDQLKLVQTFYSPTAFVDYVEQLSNKTKNGENTPEAVQEEKQRIADKIKNYYDKKGYYKEKGDPIKPEELKVEVEKHWGEKVSKDIDWQVSDIINQLFLDLQNKSPDKFYDEIMAEGDPFFGPAALRTKIQAAVNTLMAKVNQIERSGEGPLAQRMKKLALYRTSAEGGSYVEERGDGPIDKKLYPRLHPLPFEKKISLSDFVLHINQTINHISHKITYFHNGRAIYYHPAGEKGFYGQLGDFAESLKGNDIDEILLLPDGKHVIFAYQLYEKMLEEDFAQLDQRHRPDQLSPELEMVNSKIEQEVIKQLEAFYPELTPNRIRNIVNSGVGMARAIFLTEPEKSAYADPVDSSGKGMVASYSTNDAMSLNVLNSLHNSLRWQGEHNWNLMYFNPVEGQGSFWGMHDHNKSKDNMAKFMNSFNVGQGRGTGKDELPRLFVDALMDINNVGGAAKRKGWRTNYQLDGHFIYDEDGTIDAPETFKAMEAIGYEAIFNFYQTKQAGVGLLKATEETAPGRKQVEERKKLFKHIFKRYFHEGDESSFQESELDNYLAKLRKTGEKRALENIKKNKGTTSFGEEPIIEGSWEEQITYQTSQLFMENALAYYTAARMPSKFLRICKNRTSESGVSHWERTWRAFQEDQEKKNGKNKQGKKAWTREEFDQAMKNLGTAEMLLGKQMSDKIWEQISYDKKWTINNFDKIDDMPFKLDEAKIEELLSTNNKGERKFKSSEDILRVQELYRYIKEDFLKKDPNDNTKTYLDGKAFQEIKDYTFTFGLECTDISLIPYRATGPRMVARAIKDTASIEQTITPWLLNMPNIMSEIAVNGKHDISPIIDYLRKAQKAIFDVHGSEAAQKFIYEVSGTVINYFKKDGMAKPLFGLLRLGQKNSQAAEYTGRSSAAWEWDSRDIDRYITALESYRLLPKDPYDLNKTKDGKPIGGKLEDRWIKLPFLEKPIRFGKRRHVDFEYNGERLRKSHGARGIDIAFDWIFQLLPILGAYLLWKYIQDALNEVTGKKK